jgi:hypothetical protein
MTTQHVSDRTPRLRVAWRFDLSSNVNNGASTVYIVLSCAIITAALVAQKRYLTAGRIITRAAVLLFSVTPKSTPD